MNDKPMIQKKKYMHIFTRTNVSCDVWLVNHVTWRSRRRLSLVRVVNVEKRVDGLQGSRYLLELEVKDDDGGRLLRLSQYVYALHSHSRFHAWHLGNPHAQSQQVLCNPVGFKWDPAATVNIIVPGTRERRHWRSAIGNENCVTRCIHWR